MASLGSFTRSAARATFSAYRRVPIRWRLAGGSAALTLVILAGFAVVVGVLTDREVTRQYYDKQDQAFTQLLGQLKPTFVGNVLNCDTNNFSMSFFDEEDGVQIRVFDDSGNLLCSQATDIQGRPLNKQPALYPLPRSTYIEDGYRVDSKEIGFRPSGEGVVLFARPLASLNHTINEVRIFLLLGVLGGTVFALLAGLATAQRAIRPIAQLTDAAREIERTRDPSRRIPHVEANDEVAELARTLEGRLGALDASRSETETALRRQREFVADASHELRTPLTSVLANLELLADELEGEQAESAKSALRSTRRMRRLVGDLLLLARADAERLAQPHTRVDLSQVLIDAAAELEPVADQHELTIDPAPAELLGTRDDLHRMILNLLENAVNHTPPGTAVRASTSIVDGAPVLTVEDDGPGIPPQLRRQVFERFVRGGGDTGAGPRGTGLGLAIVRAVADAHGASVALGPRADGSGTRFVLTFKGKQATPARRLATDAGAAGGAEAAQTSTTTGSTIGRRRSRS